MNYLAHIYLSGNNNDLKIGNFIADSVKGKKFIKYPKGIQDGIILHRAIDTFTDIHPIFRQSSKRLFPNFRHYSGVIVDMFYDHFLAANWTEYSEVPLEIYTAEFYELLENNWGLLPRRVQGFYSYMLRDNWLVSYSTIPGLEKILTQMSHRTVDKIQLNPAIIELKEYYKSFEMEFREFFPEIENFTQQKITDLNL